MVFIFSQNINYDPNTGITREYSYGNNLIFEYKTNEDGQYHGRVSSWYENGKKINCKVAPAVYLKNFYDLIK